MQVRIFDEIASALNATYEIRPPFYGKRWDGLEADLRRGVADVAWGHIVQTADRIHAFDLSPSFDHDAYCFLVAKPPELPR